MTTTREFAIATLLAVLIGASTVLGQAAGQPDMSIPEPPPDAGEEEPATSSSSTTRPPQEAQEEPPPPEVALVYFRTPGGHCGRTDTGTARAHNVQPDETCDPSSPSYDPTPRPATPPPAEEPPASCAP